jgi:hypothetical protein
VSKEAPERKSWLRRFAVGGLSTAAAGYLGICLLLFVFQEKLIYIPYAEVKRTPADVGIEYESLSLTTDDGETIAAWYVPAAESRATVLYSHGNGGNLGNRVRVVEDLHAMGLNVLIYDYHGFGDSTGEPGETETYADAMACWKWLTEGKGVPNTQIVVWGRSLGGGVAVWLATQVEPGALVLESSFTSIPDVGAVHYPWLPVRLANRHEYPSLERMDDVRSPILVAHGDGDAIVPYAHGQALFAAATEPKSFVELSGDHNGPGLAHLRFRSQLESFLAGALPSFSARTAEG